MTGNDEIAEYPYLVRFAKQGAARYLSHHDVRRTWERVARRARLPLAYSRGFSPKPRLVFGPPLQVGAEGLREVMSLSLTERRDAATLQAALGPAAVDGMPVVDVAQAAHRRFRTAWADYRLTADAAPETLPERIARVLAAERLEITRPAVVGRPASVREIRANIIRLELAADGHIDARLRMEADAITTPRDLAEALAVTFTHIVRHDVALDADA